MNTHKNYKEIAWNNAVNAPKIARVRMHSIIVNNGAIIGYGGNTLIEHALQSQFAEREAQVYMHSETAAIVNAVENGFGHLLKGSSIYIARAKWHVTKSNKRSNIFGLAKPCSGCSRMLSWFKFKNVYYTNNEGCWEQYYTNNEGCWEQY